MIQTLVPRADLDLLNALTLKPKILAFQTLNTPSLPPALATYSLCCSSHIFFNLNNIFGPLTPLFSPKLLVPSCSQVLSYHTWSTIFQWSPSVSTTAVGRVLLVLYLGC